MASFPLLPPGLQDVAGISGRAGVQRHCNGLAIRTREHTQMNGPDEPYYRFQPQDEAPWVLNILLPNGEDHSSVHPYLPFSCLYFPLPPRPRVTLHIPPPLVHWLQSHQVSPWAKVIDSSDPHHPFLQQKRGQIFTSFLTAAKPSLSPVHPPWLLPSATSAHSSGRKPSLRRWGLFSAGPVLGTEPETPNTAAEVGIVHLWMNSEQHFAGILYSLKLYSSCLCFFPDWRKGLNITVSWNESQINFHFPKDRFSPRQVVEICNSLLKRGSFTSGQYHVLSGCHQRSWKVAYS